MTLDPGPDLAERIRELEARLEESESTIEAIRSGAIDALVVSGADEHRVYTLQNADRPYRALIEQMQEGAVTLGEDGTMLYCNCRLAALLELPQERVIGQKLHPFILGEDRARFGQLLEAARSGGARSELTLLAAGGGAVQVYISLSMLHDDGGTLLCGIVTDLTEQKLHLRELADVNASLRREIAERERVEDALRQAQKMEAVGQLTGGIAHDFNNLLTGIAGSLEMMQTRVEQGRLGELPRYVAAAQDAASRAASLTHRLLAFSRRQTLDPVPTNANRLVAGMEDLIRRTVGPAITVETMLADDLWPTLCDPHQLENAVLNLAINARDAMPDGGRLTLETSSVQFADRTAGRLGLTAGAYVVVCVTDTGVGMPPDVAARAFEPFFTTKPMGKGTGLGLSMIYGFVHQSGGQVRIDSTPGQGTRIRLYLPRHMAGEALDDAEPPPPPPARPAESGQTVLVVDDEPTVRVLVAEVLDELGYATLEAGDGAAGLRILQSGAEINLLVTDVGLPGAMNGRQLADAARVHRPGMKVLFITGYAHNADGGNSLSQRGMQVMTKPFAMTTLAAKVHHMLTDT